MKAQNVTILGLNRTGLSVGLALKQSSAALEITGYDENREVLNQAQKLGAVDKTQWKIINAVTEADIIVLSVAATQLEQTLRVIGQDLQAHALLVDMSSLKAKGQRWAKQYLAQGHYVGAAPVWAAAALVDAAEDPAGARPDLFKNSVMCLMPSPTAEPKAVETAVNLGLLLGAQPFFLDAAEYDSLSQGVQTVPGLAAAAMFRAVVQTKGWRDMLRFAQAPFAQATMPLEEAADVAYRAFNDREATLRWLDALQQELKEIRRWVADGDEERLAALLLQLNQERDLWLATRARNEWEEGQAPDIETPGLLGQMFGSRRKKEA